MARALRSGQHWALPRVPGSSLLVSLLPMSQAAEPGRLSSSSLPWLVPVSEISWCHPKKRPFLANKVGWQEAKGSFQKQPWGWGKTATAGRCSLAPFKAKLLPATRSRNERGTTLKPPYLKSSPGRLPIRTPASHVLASQWLSLKKWLFILPVWEERSQFLN